MSESDTKGRAVRQVLTGLEFFGLMPVTLPTLVLLVNGEALVIAIPAAAGLSSAGYLVCGRMSDRNTSIPRIGVVPLLSHLGLGIGLATMGAVVTLGVGWLSTAGVEFAPRHLVALLAMFGGPALVVVDRAVEIRRVVKTRSSELTIA